MDTIERKPKAVSKSGDMEYRILGRTGLKVSLICLGTMTWGEQNAQAEAFEQMDYATGGGVNFFDTAEMYAIPPKRETYGHTEQIIGNWFEKTKKRKDVILATKVAGPAQNMDWVRGGNANVAANIAAAADASLKRLKTDYIDLYQVHWPQRAVNSFGKLGFPEAQVSGREADDILAILHALQKLVTAGKVRHVGVSNETPWGVMKYLELAKEAKLPRIESIQNPYSFLNRSFEVGLAEIALQEKVGLLAYAPLAAGVLSGKYLDGQVPKGSRWDIDARVSRYKRPKTDEAVRLYLDIAKKHGLNATQMALAFVNRQTFITSTIIGATTMDQLKNNIASIAVKLHDDAVNDINAAHALLSNPCP
jgi:aryl-alcohol dehydrogenase-like predicted oxidoreductase